MLTYHYVCARPGRLAERYNRVPAAELASTVRLPVEWP